MMLSWQPCPLRFCKYADLLPVPPQTARIAELEGAAAHAAARLAVTDQMAEAAAAKGVQLA